MLDARLLEEVARRDEVTRSAMSPVPKRATTNPCTTLRPQCVPAGFAPHRYCVLFALRALCAAAPNVIRLLAGGARAHVLVYLTVVVVELTFEVVVVDTVNWGLSFTGPTGWATR